MIEGRDPTTGIFENPAVGVCINQSYLPFIIGVLEPLALPDYWETDGPWQEIEKLIGVLADAPANPCTASSHGGVSCSTTTFNGNGLGLWDVVWGTYDGANDWLVCDHVRDGAHFDGMIHIAVLAGTTVRRVRASMDVLDDTPRVSASTDLAHIYNPAYAFATNYGSSGTVTADSGTVSMDGPFDLYIYVNSDNPPAGRSADLVEVIVDYTGTTTFGGC